MGIFNKAPGVPHASLFNKRMYRNVTVVVCSFCFIAFFLLWSRGPQRHREKGYLPKLHNWPEVTRAHSFPSTSQFQPFSMDTSNKTTEDLCESFPSHMLATIQPVLKTGFSERPERFESQMDSVSSCFAPGELLIISDLQDTFRGHDIIDVLAYLPEAYREFGHFQAYLEMKEMKANGTFDRDPDALKKIDGWALDKFKFLPGIEQAWEMKPNKEFYVFYECDTYIFWDNMFRHLQSLDPDQALYFGSPSPGRWNDARDQGTLFANGGPGYVLSRGAMKKLLHRRSGPTGHYIDPPFTEKWRYLLGDLECCGDSVIGWVAYENEIMLQGYYPMFTQHLLRAMPFTKETWCVPIITLHKPEPHEMRDLFKWEFSHRKAASPLMYSDLWQYYRPGATKVRDNWDSEGRSGKRPPADALVASYEDCEQYCRDDDECLQFIWRGLEDNVCITHNYLHEGRQRGPETIDNKQVDFTSGWLTDRIQAFMESDSCETPHWVGPSLSRIF